MENIRLLVVMLTMFTPQHMRLWIMTTLRQVNIIFTSLIIVPVVWLTFTLIYKFSFLFTGSHKDSFDVTGKDENGHDAANMYKQSDSRKCSSCDPSSDVLHYIVVTRFRVANLCCAGEEKIVRSVLEGVVGVEHVSVNVIGRYVIVKHCTVFCCAPSNKIVDMLNAKHLGVSIQEVAGASDEAQEQISVPHAAHMILTCLLFIVGLVLHFFPSRSAASMGVYIASVAVGMVPILYACYVAVVRRVLDIHILMVIAVAGALAAAEYFDASLLVALFIMAEFIESVVMLNVRRAVQASSVTVAKDAYLASGMMVKVVDLKVDDVLSVRAGEMILGDGVVCKGEGSVDESALTGECVPIRKTLGSVVLSGTVVQNGYMEIRLTADTAHSTLSKLNQAVQDVQAEQGEYAKIVDRFAVYWTPCVLVGAFLFIVIGGAVSKEWYVYMYRGFVLLVLACPCAILLAAPVPSVCAIVTAAKHGVLIRGSSVIERMGLVDVVALDKTGTLTKGFFKVNERLLMAEDPSSFDPIELAAAIEQKSTHPLASAVVAEFTGCVADMAESGGAMPAVRKIVVVDGIGVSGWVEVEGDWKFVFVGNEKLLYEHGGKVRTSPKQQQMMKDFNECSRGRVVLLVAVDDSLELMLSLSDEVRAEAPAFVRRLSEMRMEVSMITGDHELVARDVCIQVGIKDSQCFSRLLPSEKLDWVNHAQNPSSLTSNGGSMWLALKSLALCGKGDQQQRSVLMVGDGINDSTALTASDVGVAMGAGGSAMAVASADVILMTDNLFLLPPAIKLCQLARHTIQEGFIFAIAVKIMAIILAIMGRLEFWHAIIIDLGSLVVVVLNGSKPLYATRWFTEKDVTRGADRVGSFGGVEMV